MRAIERRETRGSPQGLAAASGGTEELVAHADSVRFFCASQLGSPEEAEDAAQETFVRFLLRPKGEIRNPEAWLIGVARRVCYKVIRDRHGGGRELALDRLVADSNVASPEDAALASTLVRTLFQHLGARDAQLLARLYLAGHSVEQVADAMGLQPSHVRTIAVRARRRANRILGGGVAAGLIPFWARRLLDRFRRLAGATDPASVASLAVSNSLALVVTGLLVIGAVAGNGRLTPPPTESASAPLAHAPHPLAADATAPATPPRRAGQSETPSASSPIIGNAASAWVGDVIASDEHPQEQNVEFTSFTPSPAYPHDATIFASGTEVTGCPGVCPVLFVSHDGARSWQLLAAVGFAGGQILLPPAYAADSTIFAVGASGLQRSDDAGRTFTLAVPRATQAAVQPGAAAGQALIVLATVPLLVYSEASGLVSPGPALPPGIGAVNAIAYLADGQHIVVAGERADPAARGQIDGILSTCDALQCAVGSAYPGIAPELLSLSPSEASDHVVVAALGSVVATSHDAGQSFAGTQLPAGGGVVSVTLGRGVDATSEMFVDATEAGARSVLLRSVDWGASFSMVRPSGLPPHFVAGAVVLLPGGDLLMGLDSLDQNLGLGVRCSADGGVTWVAACP